ncbi:hypothetical protein ACWDKQ_12630 [Saccharopolyspora sp. NPDC000995]
MPGLRTEDVERFPHPPVVSRHVDDRIEPLSGERVQALLPIHRRERRAVGNAAVRAAGRADDVMPASNRLGGHRVTEEDRPAQYQDPHTGTLPSTDPAIRPFTLAVNALRDQLNFQG